MTLDDDDIMRATQREALVVQWQECFSDGTPRDMAGNVYAFSVFGPGVGRALGTPHDEVSAESVLLEDHRGPFLEMRFPLDVSFKLAGLPNLRWQLARVLANGLLDDDSGGLIVIARVPGIEAMPPAMSDDSDAIFFRVIPETDFLTN